MGGSREATGDMLIEFPSTSILLAIQLVFPMYMFVCTQIPLFHFSLLEFFFQNQKEKNFSFMYYKYYSRPYSLIIP